MQSILFPDSQHCRDFFTTMKAAATYPLVFRFHLYMMHHTHATNTLAHFNPLEGENLPNLKTIEKILRKPTERNTRLYILGIIRLAFAIVDSIRFELGKPTSFSRLVRQSFSLKNDWLRCFSNCLGREIIRERKKMHGMQRPFKIFVDRRSRKEGRKGKGPKRER